MTEKSIFDIFVFIVTKSMSAVDFDDYKLQLQAVEQAIHQTHSKDEKEELEALRSRILELLELTSGNEVEKNAEFDEEILRFQTEIQAIENVGSSKGDLTEDLSSDVEKKLQELKVELEKLVGQKCSAPHQHTWGSTAYHNAIVCGVADDVDVETDGHIEGRLRVFFTNPTHKEMLPCIYFLDGEDGCRFDGSKCHYSHGEVVKLDQLREYREPNFEHLARNCLVLAKCSNRLWQRGRVIYADFEEKECRVRLDARDEKEREKNYKFEDLLPIFHDETFSNGSSSESTTNSDTEFNDEELTRRAEMVQQSLFTFRPNQALGEWEKHTKGIGSKLMEKMGYIHGTGLGSMGQGIVVPVFAQILPQGRSLDYCMQLREKSGNGDLFSAERKLISENKKQDIKNLKAYTRKSERLDVFSFLNKNIFSDQRNINSKEAKFSKKQSPSNLKEKSTKSLNIESVRISDEIRKKERELLKTQESMQRNANSTEMNQKLQAQLMLQKEELQSLYKNEKSLHSEQSLRKSKNKLCVF